MEKIEAFRGKYFFLSSHFFATVELDAKIYSTSEHAFHASKTFNLKEREKIRLLATPGQAKRAGRKLRLRTNWNKVRVQTMRRIVDNKFFRDEDLAKKLIATYPMELIEGNTWHDNFWGNCICSECKDIEGRNHLGKTLMKTRKVLMGCDLCLLK